ncbi:MAG TPA: peptidylprolyl isomerase [Anaeromyxobacteraceae bacterium]|nr:peptidylprolyl isomerase [Anaeromyxobacteraceae bacterium]
MFRRTILLGAVLALACSEGPKKSGPVIAEGKGVKITADEFKARIEEQSPFMRARYSTLERKKEFLENLVQFELIAKEAEKEGLQNDPDVQVALKKLMVQKLLTKRFGDPTKDATSVPDSELQAYYDAHKDEYFRAKRMKVSLVQLNAAEGAPERATKLAAAKKALETLKASEKKNPGAFAALANAQSEDAASNKTGGDVGFRTQAELEKTYSKPLADAVFALTPGQTSGVIETPNAIFLAKVTGVQDEVNRPFDTVKTQIAYKLSREKKTKELETWRKQLAASAKVEIDEKALEQVEIAAAPAGMPGARGMMGGMGGGMMGGPRVTPAPAAPTSAPAPTPATK